MPRNYWIYQATGFPVIEPGCVWNVPYQVALLDEVGDGLKTEFTHEYTFDDMRTDAYRVLYEVVEKKAGRIGNTPFQQITAEYRFPAFVFRTEGLLVLQAKSSQARGVARRLTHAGGGLTLDHSRVDLDAVRRIIPSITGAWLSVEDSADVTSQAFFGPSVDRDERFGRALGEGGLRYIWLPYKFQGEIVNLGLSGEGSILVLDNNLDTHFELQLILTVKEHLLDSCPATVRPTMV